MTDTIYRYRSQPGQELLWMLAGGSVMFFPPIVAAWVFGDDIPRYESWHVLAFIAYVAISMIVTAKRFYTQRPADAGLYGIGVVLLLGAVVHWLITTMLEGM